MAIALLHSTSAAIGTAANGCESRALFAARFADPQASDKTTPTRKKWFTDLIGKKAAPLHPSHAWLPKNAEILRARLQARLLVNLAGGVMENANVSLDRYGYPLIPGSAVKGCARRMALQALHDWHGAPASAGQSAFLETDACAPCCKDFTTPAEMLAAIARIFGWIKDDWKTSSTSDFAWACHGNETHLKAARDLLPPHDTFAGTVAFLPATPNRDPGLELDVLTPHHTAYHEGKPSFENAPDTEDPVPVFFPAIAPQKDGDHFTFPLIPLRLARPGDLALAKNWLAHGLELFGLGAKTHAGYGWFQIISDGKPVFADRFEPRLSPVESFLRNWGGKPINSMNARGFSKLAADFDKPALMSILETIVPGKTADFKDPFWNPFKSDPVGKALLEKIRPQI